MSSHQAKLQPWCEAGKHSYIIEMRSPNSVICHTFNASSMVKGHYFLKLFIGVWCKKNGDITH